MEIYQDYRDKKLPRRTVMGIGNFDGLHLGHQAVIREVVERAGAGRIPSILLTFHPHPMSVVGNETPPPMIYTVSEKKVILEAMGLEGLILQTFDRSFALMTAEMFISEVLVEHLAPKVVVVGHDFRFGEGGKGNVSMLDKSGRNYGFTTVSVDEVIMDGVPVRSSRVRDLIASGAVAEAAILLGRPYHLTGEVIYSVGIGKKIGFPTANLVPPEKLIPPDGVYAGETVVEGRAYPAAINIGFPMKRDGRRVVECHLLKYEGAPLYGKTIIVRFCKRLREERRFSNLKDLAGQIAKDISLVKALFKENQY